MALNHSRSMALFRQAQALLPGGVDSPVRAFKAVGGQPLFIERGEGPYLVDVDGNRYIDYVLSWGPLILGHAHPDVVKGLQETLACGTSFGAPSPLEIELAQMVKAAMPNIEMIRFVNSGTEATMSALRLARAFTRRNKIIKFEGCYHGHADLLLVQAGSGVATLGLPDSPGVPPATVKDTLVAPYNDIDAVESLFQSNQGEIAAIIVEPVAGNMGVVPPVEGFLPGLRRLADEHGAVLIFDEVMTGFRVHPGGAQTLYGVRPDLTTLGKVIGGGLPVGAYGGRGEMMQMVAPSGPVYQAGTLSGNPLAMKAGITTLKALQQPGTWESLMAMSNRLTEGIGEAAKSAGIQVQQTQVGSMFTLFFNASPVHNWNSVKTSNLERFAHFFRSMLEGGVYLAPSQFEAGFTSTMHDAGVIDLTIEACERSFKSLTKIT
ncbi:MAG: glutamate-1-semialdehyde-2,1-aminomutase [Chloroflexota bacterium]|nr:MAG: glutamate-1-semialdehyde-2,1-aminomutase [Chloroflexota bacterium]